MAAFLEQLLVYFDVVVIDGVIEGDHDHLRDGIGFQSAGDLCPVRGTETIRKDTL